MKMWLMKVFPDQVIAYDPESSTTKTFQSLEDATAFFYTNGYAFQQIATGNDFATQGVLQADPAFVAQAASGNVPEYADWSKTVNPAGQNLTYEQAMPMIASAGAMPSWVTYAAIGIVAYLFLRK